MLQISSMWNSAGAFFDSPTKEQYLMGISREIGLAHTSLKRNLEYLAKEGIIKESIFKKGSRKYPVYTAKTDSATYKRAKRTYNITSITESGLVEHIADSLMPRCIILFGSYARGEDVEESDIDLFIECKEQKVELERFEKALKRKIQLHFRDKFTSLPNEIKNNIINGVVLYGFLEGYK